MSFSDNTDNELLRVITFILLLCVCVLYIIAVLMDFIAKFFWIFGAWVLHVIFGHRMITLIIEYITNCDLVEKCSYTTGSNYVIIILINFTLVVMTSILMHILYRKL